MPIEDSDKYVWSGCGGFTLLELAIVLFILTLILGGLLAPMAVQVEQQDRRETIQRMNEVRDAIYGFTIINGRLPCPDCRDTQGTCSADIMNDGIEDIPLDGAGNPDGECRTDVGNIPWTTLGVSGTDAWANRFTYRVDGEFADTNDGTSANNCLETPGVSFELCAEGDIEIRKDPNDSGSLTASGIPAIIVSHGKEYEFRSDFELANNGEDNIFVDRPISPDFDDILVWISPHQLRMNMLRAGVLP